MERPRTRVGDQTSIRWTEIALGARFVGELLDITGDPAPSSPLAHDDLAYPNEKLTAWVRSYLRASSEHLIMWADLVAPLQVFEGQDVVSAPRPFYTLARAAMEAAAQAAWVVEPIDSDERVRRHIRLLVHDLVEMVKALNAVGDVARANAARDRIATTNERFGGPVSPAPAYLDMVKAAARWSGRDQAEAESTWRLSSAAAHGRNWFMGASHHVLRGDEFEPGYFRTTQIPDAEQAADALQLGSDILIRATLRYLEGCGYDVTRCMDAARERLASNIPLKPGVGRDQLMTRLRSVTGTSEEAEVHG